MVTNNYDFSGVAMLQPNPGESRVVGWAGVRSPRPRAQGVVQSGLTNASLVNFAIRIDMVPKYLSRMAGGHLTIVAPKGVPVFVDVAHLQAKDRASCLRERRSATKCQP